MYQSFNPNSHSSGHFQFSSGGSGSCVWCLCLALGLGGRLGQGVSEAELVVVSLIQRRQMLFEKETL